MRSIALTVIIVLLAPSMASAAWTYAGPAPMIVPGPVPYTVNYAPVAPAPVIVPTPAPYVVNYAPAAPVWAQPVVVPGRVVVRRAPVVYAPPAPVVYGPPAPVGYVPLAPAVYGPSPVVSYKVYYPGQPVRNVLRAVLP